MVKILRLEVGAKVLLEAKRTTGPAFRLEYPHLALGDRVDAVGEQPPPNRLLVPKGREGHPGVVGVSRHGHH